MRPGGRWLRPLAVAALAVAALALLIWLGAGGLRPDYCDPDAIGRIDPPGPECN